MNLYIIRHGETDWNKQGRLQGASDIPLNEYGIELAEKTRDGFLKDGIYFDKVFSSPYLRAKETAKIVTDNDNISILIDERIREMGFGNYEGAKVSEFKTNPAYKEINKCFTDPVHYQREGNAESYEELYERVESFLTDCILPLENSCENVLVVCHGAVIRAFITIIKKMPLADFWTIHQKNCSVNLVRINQGKMTMAIESFLYYKQDIDERRGFV